MCAEPIGTLELPRLLAVLRCRERQIIGLIDADPKIKKRRGGCDGSLVIANAASSLTEPVSQHQLYAKGIVYRGATLELVSLPLVKMFNHGHREHNDATTREVAARDGIRVTFPHKHDGTMIQLFAADGRVWLSTRSVLEGDAPFAAGSSNTEETLYTDLARTALMRTAPRLLNPVAVGRRTLIFELIHPKTRQLTFYGTREDMVLISVYDQLRWRYWKTSDVIKFASDAGLAGPTLLIEEDGLQLDRGIDILRASLAGNPINCEGAVVCFEDDEEIVHRVKVKMDDYLRQLAIRRKVSLRKVVDRIWDKPELHEWDGYLAYIKEREKLDEELEMVHKSYHDVFAEWLVGTRAHRAAIEVLAEACELEMGGRAPELNTAERSGYLKDAAKWCGRRAGKDFTLVMTRLRRGCLSLALVMTKDRSVLFGSEKENVALARE